MLDRSLRCVRGSVQRILGPFPKETVAGGARRRVSFLLALGKRPSLGYDYLVLIQTYDHIYYINAQLASRLIKPMSPLTFNHHPPRSDRHHFITEADVRVVLERLPKPLWEGLTAVHFNDRAMGRRRLGYVQRGRDEIALCALPRRVSLASFLRRSQSPTQYGAVRGCQWPGLAVRRYMLYDVFLHQLGLLQVVNTKAKTTDRRFAGETRAQQFAEQWCRTLWSQPFDHPDPVHNPPSPEELEGLRDGWQTANHDYKQGLRAKQAKRYDQAVLLTRAVERYPGHAMALEQLGILTYSGYGTPQSLSRSIDILNTAIQLDPTLLGATVFLALALAWENREPEARRCFEVAIRLDTYPLRALSMYADSIADWGYFAEAEALFQKIIKRDEKCVVAIRDYGRTLLRDHNPDAMKNIGRAIPLFERAVDLNPEDAESHYRLGDALPVLDGQLARAIHHLERALKINPLHAKAAKRLAELRTAEDGPGRS